jgi:hypothetical protein
MSGHNTNVRPTCSWVTVTDERGRTHLEARWGTPVQVQRDAA